MMQAIKGGFRRRKKQRYAASWGVAIAVLSLTLPATAMAAQGQVRPERTRTGPKQATTRGSRDAVPGARLGHPLLALGSGYGISDGSPLVRDLQRRLALVGYAPGGVDGLFGPQTWRAVLAFQASHELPVDGVVGPRTWTALSAPALILGPGAGDQPGGSTAVRSLQRRLTRGGDAPGPIDGRYGALTERAVRRFQSAHRLLANGMAGARTLALLGVSLSRTPAVTHKPGLSPKPGLSHKPHGSNSGSHVPGSNLAPAPAQRPAIPAPTTVPHVASHRSSPSAVPWVTIAGGLALVLALILTAPLMAGAVRRARRRRDDETPVASPVKTPANPVVLEETHVATARDHDQAAPQQNGSPVRANGHHAKVGENGHHARVSETAADAADAFDVGMWLEAQGSLAEAQAAYVRADERGHGAAASNLGRLLEEQGALAEAEAAYRRADERGDGVGAFNLAVLLEEREALDEAEAAYRRAADRGYGAAATNLGVLLEERGEPEEAEAAYWRAVEHGAAAASFNLGVLLEERGDLVAAGEAYGCAEERGDADVANMARAALLDLRRAAQTSGDGGATGADNG